MTVYIQTKLQRRKLQLKVPEHTKNNIRLTAAQMRAARGLVDWTGAKLAEISRVGLHTIRRMETMGPEHSTAANVEAIRRALEDEGVVFIEADPEAELGPGVRLKA